MTFVGDWLPSVTEYSSVDFGCVWQHNSRGLLMVNGGLCRGSIGTVKRISCMSALEKDVPNQGKRQHNRAYRYVISLNVQPTSYRGIRRAARPFRLEAITAMHQFDHLSKLRELRGCNMQHLPLLNRCSSVRAPIGQRTQISASRSTRSSLLDGTTLSPRRWSPRRYGWSVSYS